MTPRTMYTYSTKIVELYPQVLQFRQVDKLTFSLQPVKPHGCCRWAKKRAPLPGAGRAAPDLAKHQRLFGSYRKIDV